jgi:hypothetical protein
MAVGPPPGFESFMARSSSSPSLGSHSSTLSPKAAPPPGFLQFMASSSSPLLKPVTPPSSVDASSISKRSRTESPRTPEQQQHVGPHVVNMSLEERTNAHQLELLQRPVSQKFDVELRRELHQLINVAGSAELILMQQTVDAARRGDIADMMNVQFENADDIDKNPTHEIDTISISSSSSSSSSPASDNNNSPSTSSPVMTIGRSISGFNMERYLEVRREAERRRYGRAGAPPLPPVDATHSFVSILQRKLSQHHVSSLTHIARSYCHCSD